MDSRTIADTLREQQELVERLLETANQKTPVLVHNDIERLSAITLKERKLVQQAEELERKRMTLANLYFSKMGFRTRNAKLSDMIRTVSNPQEKTVLLELQRGLADKLAKLKSVNELNQQLISQSLRFIDYSIDLLVEKPLEDIVYRHPMQHSGGNRPTGWFDKKA
ncbi:flagellar protein FlgN [Paenibacillus humicola]|uniref:flagellar protein FlgN n=1 Tax=Paenibacillus humicola TaxID=3110540 RepID=UPI00237B05AD|nr:flagellar protein FlgN [Paenibacillus humicola]